MHEVALIVELEVDGIAVDGFPYGHRISVEDLQDFLSNYLRTPRYQSAPIERIKQLRGCALAPTKALCVRVNGQSDGQIDLNDTGVLIIFDAEIDDSPATNLTLKTQEGVESSLVDGFGCGSGLDSARDAASDAATTGEGGFGA